MRCAHDHAIGAGIEQRPHDVLLRLLPVDRDGDRVRIAARLGRQPIELLARLLQVGRSEPIGQPAVPLRQFFACCFRGALALLLFISANA